MAASQPDNALPQAQAKAEPQAPTNRARTFSVDAQWVRNSNGLRFDAEHYNPTLAKAIAMLRASGMDLRPLSEVTERVFIPPRFKRVYVERAHGVPFVQGSHIAHFQPTDLKYISPAVHREIDRWLIRENWILVTRSGTVGRVAITPKSWDGWAASEHLLRIIPALDGVCPPGYLHAFLQSSAGQTQLTSQIYGAVVDELTEDQARAILVPVARTAAQREAVQRINETGLKALRLRDAAVAGAMATARGTSELLGEPAED